MSERKRPKAVFRGVLGSSPAQCITACRVRFGPNRRSGKLMAGIKVKTPLFLMMLLLALAKGWLHGLNWQSRIWTLDLSDSKYQGNDRAARLGHVSVLCTTYKLKSHHKTLKQNHTTQLLFQYLEATTFNFSKVYCHIYLRS